MYWPFPLSPDCEKEEPVACCQEDRLLRPFILLLSTLVLDFQPNDTFLLWGVIHPWNRQLFWSPGISPSYCSPTPFSHHSPCLFLWHCSLPWNFFSRLSWYTRCPEPSSCLSAFSQTRAAGFPPVHHNIKSSPQRSLGSVVLIWIDVLDHLTLSPTILVLQPLWYDNDCIYSITQFQTESPLLRDSHLTAEAELSFALLYSLTGSFK